MALDPEFKKAWVKALRENKHRQCTHSLWDGEGNACAFGVAWETLGVANREQYEIVNKDVDFWKFPTRCGTISFAEANRIAKCMNDGEYAGSTGSKDFDTIAAHIEQNL